MIKRLFGSLREYKMPAIITLLFILSEAVIETFIPFITAELVNRVQAQAEIAEVLKTGLLLVVMAVLSLVCGGAAAFTCSYASAGFAKNLRSDMFQKIQTFSFENIDRFSSSSLVTRMTTDVNNVQMSFMMIIRIALRSPLMLVFSIVMAYIMGGPLASAFVVAVPILGIGLYQIAKRAMPAFRRVFKKYDRMNESIEENIRAMRIVKGFSREEYEKAKFKDAAEDICIDFTKAEKLIALNMPLMQLCMNFNSVFILYVGSKMVINGIGNVGIGQISAMISYGVQVLMSLMMLSMIYVMLTMSAESAKRIAEVLDETPSLKEPQNPKKAVSDGSVEFNNVSFKYSPKAKKRVLSDINVKIPAGTTVGIIGGTGVGKSSLVQLIARLYDVS
ncbi:MAG: ATP-binding cassette domain-containing protein, partial [Firmicutes bacterium]|nr:ATP-binding cassette domain-containing protein [Bacillota bacterium]